MPRFPLGRPGALGKDGAAATPVPTSLQASLPLPELNETAVSNRKSGAQLGGSLQLSPKVQASRHPSVFPGSLRPSAPATPPRDAPPAALKAQRREVGSSSRLGGPTGHFRPSAALPPLSGMAARRSRACAAVHGAAGVGTGAALSGRTGG